MKARITLLLKRKKVPKFFSIRGKINFYDSLSVKLVQLRMNIALKDFSSNPVGGGGVLPYIGSLI